MKFIKSGLLTTLFLSALVLIVYCSCERNVCDNVTCFNGGSCGQGICTCPVGYEGVQCEMKSRDRYIGVYGGYTQCNGGAYLVDTVWVTPDPIKLNYVIVSIESLLPKTFRGYVSNNEATYSIVLPDETRTNYRKMFTVTLQGNKTLTIHTYEQDYSVLGDTTINNCNFLGSKH